MGGNFAAQRHQQPEEFLNHGERDHSLFCIFTAPSAWSCLGVLLKHNNGGPGIQERSLVAHSSWKWEDTA